MTATAFVEGIKKLPSLLPSQAEQLISLAPHMTDAQRKEALVAVQKQHAIIEKNQKEGDMIMTAVEKKTDALYKKEWPKIKDAIQDEERESSAKKLDAEIDAA
jgi:hypothetical protein